MCVNPLVRFRFKYVPKPGSPINFFSECISKFQYDEVLGLKKRRKKDGFIIKSKKKLEKYFNSHGQYLAFMDSYCDYTELPCGKCEECRKSYARDWSVRCYHESLFHNENSYLTLTFSNLANDIFNKEIEKSFKNGTNKLCKNCINGSNHYRYPVYYSLNKGLIKLWIKKMRDYLYRKYKISIRYFGCGEYGSEEKTNRSHFHLIVFGYGFNSNDNFRTFQSGLSKTGFPIYISEELVSLWPYGNSYVEPLTMNACSYVAQYCLKKVKPFDSEDLFDYYYGKVPEYIFMSRGNCQSNRCKYIDDIVSDRELNSLRNFNNKYCKNCNKTRGGLGFQWICKYLYDVKNLGYILIDGKKYPIPKYYKNLINLTDKNLYDKLRSDNIYYVNDRLIRSPDENSTKNNLIRHKINVSRLRSRVSRDFSD